MGMGKWVAKLGQDTDMETFLLILLCRVFVTTSQKDYCVNNLYRGEGYCVWPHRIHRSHLSSWHLCSMAYSYDWYTCMIRSDGWQATFITHLFVWRDSSIRGTWHIYLCDVIHPCVRHDVLTSVIWHTPVPLQTCAILLSSSFAICVYTHIYIHTQHLCRWRCLSGFFAICVYTHIYIQNHMHTINRNRSSDRSSSTQASRMSARACVRGGARWCQLAVT